jgi:hypothetical protein
MTVAEREFTFDVLLAEFGDDEHQARADEAPAPASAVAVGPAPTNGSASKVPRAEKPRTRSARPEASPAPVASKSRSLRRSFAAPSDDVLKLGGLVVVAGISLTLAFVALSR